MAPSHAVEIETSLGPARAHCDLPLHGRAPSGRLVLGHGAGGGVQAKDLLAVRTVAVRAGWAVARVEQPWRVAGKRVASPPPRLDVAWLDVLRALGAAPADAADDETARDETAAPDVPRAVRTAFGRGTPLVLGGRSAGARVACRTAGALRADGVLCLAFPLHPPGKPGRSRADELALVSGVPLLVVQGKRDPFGGPDDVRLVAPPAATVLGVDGDHALAKDLATVREGVAGFLDRLAQAPG